MKDQIWNLLSDMKFKGYLLSFLVKRYQRLDRWINVSLAVASSGSIAAWAIWKAVPMLWAGIIAFSQVFTVVKPYFPYYKYVKELNSKCLRMEIINLEIEKLWSKMQRKKIDDDIAEESYFAIRKQTIEILNFGDETFFDVDNKIKRKANLRMKIFLKSTYGIDISPTN